MFILGELNPWSSGMFFLNCKYFFQVPSNGFSYYLESKPEINIKIKLVYFLIMFGNVFIACKI